MKKIVILAMVLAVLPALVFAHGHGNGHGQNYNGGYSLCGFDDCYAPHYFGDGHAYHRGDRK
jgi:hypothetical protein